MRRSLTVFATRAQLALSRAHYHFGGNRLEGRARNNPGYRTEPAYLRRERFSLSAVRTKSTTDPACILRMTLPRWIFTVASLAPISEAICLLSIPETTRAIICCSRAVNAP